MLWKKLLLALFSVLFTLAMLEAAARVWVWIRWPEHKVRYLSNVSPIKGRFMAKPNWGYVLTPDARFEMTTHNPERFRGPTTTARRVQAS